MDLFRSMPLGIKAFFVLCLLMIAVGFFICSNSCSRYPQDNFVEEAVELLLEAKTGLDVDLSPFSAE